MEVRRRLGTAQPPVGFLRRSDRSSDLRAALLLEHEILIALGGDLRRIISRRSWTRRCSTIGLLFSSEKTMIDHLILRLETFPQDGGTRPGQWINPQTATWVDHHTTVWAML